MSTPDYSPARALMRAARQRPHRDSIIWLPEGHKWSVSDSAEAVRRTASYLRALGIGEGDRVVLAAANTPWCYVLHCACSWLGAVTVPLSERLPLPVFKELLVSVKPRLLLLDEGLALPGTLLKDFTSEALSAEPIEGEPPKRSDEIAAIVFTSGSAGRTRGVELTHSQLWWGSMCFRDGFEYCPGHEVLGVCAPISHIGGFNGTTIDVFTHGGTLVVFPTFDPRQVLLAIEEHRITMMFLVPIMCHFLLDENAHVLADLSSWARPLIGGDLLSPALAARMREVGLRPIHVWGMTETSGAGLMASPDSGAPAGALGAPFPYVDVRLVDEDGAETHPGTVGEIEVRGPGVASSFLNAGEEGPARIREGWLRTGDLATRDEEGWFMMLGRKSRMINTGGELVAPTRIEELLLSLPEVKGACVVGVADARWGQRVAALLVPRAGVLARDALEIARSIDELLAPWERVRQALWVEAIPLLPNGKPNAPEVQRILEALD
ncbi:class I adenylate-forming enzyme family protein [Schaalia cardiffensis]|uniref:class I adenylate-forming enzyme family protein n=1 Tax=Schaalia cardiffensis TaxID=181487 RepID=UPI002AB20305|nr:class I adenylate-forming enzyme family protein [Schaalia cardiffensis]